MLVNPAALYIAKPEFLQVLCAELKGDYTVLDQLVFSNTVNPTCCFVKDIWFEPQIVSFQSISEAAKILRQAGKLWAMYPITQIRRATLIAESLRPCPSLYRHFPIEEEIPTINMFGLLDKNTLIYSTKRLKQWPQGDCLFIEDKVNPPNRAYLKLWEALTLLNRYPQAGETALDLGASPGGWTYVMQSLGAEVTAVDKAALDPKIMRLPNIHFLQQSAFALNPDELDKPYDWVLSDVACYPDKAYNLILKWITSGKAKQLIFTIKLQGETDLNALKKFQDIPDSRLINLFYNKHEVTFFYPQ